jgi:hypothetical protein
VLGVGIVGSLELSCASKSCVIRVLASDNKLNRLKDFKAIRCRQRSVSGALKLSEELILLRRFDLVNNVS